MPIPEHLNLDELEYFTFILIILLYVRQRSYLLLKLLVIIYADQAETF